jgi:LCP family protein required for cell wall assembly
VNGDDTTYTVYRAGRDAPVRRVTRRAGVEAPAEGTAAPPDARAGERASSIAGARGGEATPGMPLAAPVEPLADLSRRRRVRPHRARTAALWLLGTGTLGVAVVLFWLYGRQPLRDLWAVLDLAETTGDVPSWVLVGVPALAAALAGLVTAYLAYGRHLALKIVGLIVVTVALAAPGFALGWTNGTLGGMGDRDAGVVARVKHAREKLQPPLPGKAVNVLLLGADVRPGDPGRSDTLLLVRLDPKAKSITMLSFPRDLYVELPGYGYDKINAAYPYGGPALCVETVSQLTGLPIHHFIEVDFSGFWNVVNILGGVYYPVDRRYYNPESSTWKSIDIEPGYQLLKGHDALDFVRFRHDARGDFTRILRQQTFLKELQRQSGRWNRDWKRVTKLLTSITKQTTSDLDSLQNLLPLASLALTLNTSKVHTVHIEGGTQMMGNASYVVASAEEIAAAVAEFSNPTEAPVVNKGRAMPRKAYGVRVFNGSGVAGVASLVKGQLAELGFHARAVGNADTFTYETSIVYASAGMRTTAEQFVRLLSPAELRLIPRVPGGVDGITLVVGSAFDGTLDVPEAPVESGAIVATEGRYDEAGWRALADQTPIKLQMPGVWASGLVYDEYRAYRLETPSGRQAASAVAVGRTPSSGYFSIQVTRWLDPPAIAHPTAKKKIGGTTYLLFYSGTDLHMVAWRRGNCVYWVLNTIDDQLTADFMLALATSFEPLDAVQPEVTPSP